MGFVCSSESQMEQGREANLCTGACHAEQILQQLNSYRKSSTFTDVVLLVDGCEFPCHRVALCASSQYFRAMFKGQMRESHQSLVHLQEISAASMEDLLNFVYEGKAHIDESNVESLFRAADLLGVAVLRQACVMFLENRLDHSNCLGIRTFASTFFLLPLEKQCHQLLYQDFVEVSKHEEFLELSQEELIKLFSSEELKVEREEVLLEAVLKWVMHCPTERRPALKELLELVHLPLVDPGFFIKMLQAEDILLDCKECRPLLLEALKYQNFGKEVHSKRTQPRRSSERTQMIVVIGGCDSNIFTRPSFTEKLNIHTKQWHKAAAIPGHCKSEFAACELQNDIYISGGFLNSSDTWRYMPQLDHWAPVAQMAKSRWRHKMASLYGKLYAVGGYNGRERLSSVERYCSYDNQWQEVAPLLEAVSSAAVAACHEKLYVIGGATSDSCSTNKVQCYDPVKNEWRYMKPSPFSQKCLNATTLNDTIYVVGGLLDVIYCYSSKTDTWSKGANLPIKVESCGLTVCDGRVYILGGQDECGASINRTWVFSPDSGQLSEELPMLRCSSYHGCVTVTERVPAKGQA